MEQSKARGANNRGGRDSGVALLSAVFFMVLVAGLSVVLLSAILAQSHPAFVAQKNTRTVYAAEAGLQATLGILRSAAAAPNAANQVFGDVRQLPCSIGGQVNAVDDGTTYSVQISYFTNDPASSTESWRADNALACPLTPPPGGVQPRYAYIRSGGLGDPIPGNANSAYGDRYLAAIYKFKMTSNLNVPGGMIFSSNKTYCMTAKRAESNSKIGFEPAPCVGNDLNMWVAGPDHQIKLATSVTKTSLGLCITGPKDKSKDEDKKDKTEDARLEECRATDDPARWNQLWSWEGVWSWKGQQDPISAGRSGYCLSPGRADGSALNGAHLEAAVSCLGTFAPSPSVGAGAASYATHQIVNYKHFGQCADVTNEDLNSTFMIAYPCKQDPRGAPYTDITWNHKWFYKEPPSGQVQALDQEIYVLYKDQADEKWCFQTPAAAAGSTDTFFATCNGSDQQQWDRVYNSGDYPSSYVFIDTYGRCLAADAAASGSPVYSILKMQTCNGSLEQKWNAPPTTESSNFGGYREVSG